MEGRVDRHLRYADIKDHPETYRGKLMLAGGKVLPAKRTQDRIWIEVLQIPPSEDLIPTGRDSDSKGRFVIIDRGDQVPDSAAFNDKEKRVTIVGEVLGTTTIQIDDVQQQVPELAVKHITVWDWDHMKGGMVGTTATTIPFHGHTVGTTEGPIRVLLFGSIRSREGLINSCLHREVCS